MVCISCISNVNQLGNYSHCDAMAQHLHGNRGFLVQFMDFKMPISSSQMLEINRESQQMDPLCIKSKSHVCHCPSGSVSSQQTI